jgi:predicted CopG family antitoxin
MVGSTQIMIQNHVYDELTRYRDKHGFKSFTVALKSLLELHSQITSTYAKMPNHTFQTVQTDNSALPEKVKKIENEVTSWNKE